MKSKRLEVPPHVGKSSINTGIKRSDVQAETDKAYLVRAYTNVWLPKSQVAWVDGIIHLPDWLVKIKFPE